MQQDPGVYLQQNEQAIPFAVLELDPTFVQYFIRFATESKNVKHLHIASSTIGGMRAVTPLLQFVIDYTSDSTISLGLCGAALEEAKTSGVLNNFIPFSESSVGTPNEQLFCGSFNFSKVTTTIITVPNDSPLEALTALSIKRLGLGPTYLIVENWGDPGALLRQILPTANGISGIFCTDSHAKENIRHFWPNFDSERIYTTGTGHTDNIVKIDHEALRKPARTLLGIEPQAECFLFLGGTTEHYSRISLQHSFVSKMTLDLFVEELSSYAVDHPDRKFCVLVRPHPSDYAPKRVDDKQGLTLYVAQKKVPSNLKLVLAGKSIISIHQACAATDLIIGMEETDPYLARWRSRIGMYLILERLGKAIFEKFTLLGCMKNLKGAEGLMLISKLEQLRQVFDSLPFQRKSQNKITSNSSEAILKVLEIASQA